MKIHLVTVFKIHCKLLVSWVLLPPALNYYIFRYPHCFSQPIIGDHKSSEPDDKGWNSVQSANRKTTKPSTLRLAQPVTFSFCIKVSCLLLLHILLAAFI